MQGCRHVRVFWVLLVLGLVARGVCQAQPYDFRLGGPGVEVMQQQGAEKRTVATITLPGGAREVLRQGARLYVVPRGDGLLLFDVTDPRSPRFVAAMAPERRVMALTEYEGGGLVRFTDGSLLRLGASTPVAAAAPPQAAGGTMSTVPAQRPARSFYFRGGAGFAYRWALREDFLAGAVDLMVGTNKGSGSALGARLSAELGRTVAGLLYGCVMIGPEGEFSVYHRIRISVGGGAGAMFVRRATMNRALIGTMIWLSAQGTLDLIAGRSGRSALFVGLRPEFAVGVSERMPLSFVAMTIVGLRR